MFLENQDRFFLKTSRAPYTNATCKRHLRVNRPKQPAT
jgi:hypothetical protein